MKSAIHILALAAMTMPLASLAQAAPETFTLDPNHTNIVWHTEHFGFSSPSGRFGIKDGTLTLDEAKPANSKIDVTIDTSGLVTGISKFDEHLKSADFLDVAKYPTATFKSTKVVLGDDKDEAKVHGNLTLHGVTKPVILDVELNKIGVNPMSKKKTVGFSAETEIKRSDFGIKTALPDVADIVRIGIESEASLADAAPVTKK